MREDRLQNARKIVRNRERVVKEKSGNRRVVKLMEANSKENIRKYWVERTDYIRGQRSQEKEAKLRMMNSSMENIEALKERERKIREDIRKVSEVGETFLGSEQRFSDKASSQDYSRILKCLEAEVAEGK